MASSPLQAEIFITRTDGTMTTLVAVDELPHRIVVEGVPRVVTQFDIDGMKNLGCFRFRHRQYSLDNMYRAPTNNTSVSTGEPLKAKFFITRDNGALVPLVAMDEMPEHFALEGVPRLVTVHNMSGMVNRGVHEARGKLHTITDVNDATFRAGGDSSSPVLSSEQSQTVTNTARATPVVPTPVISTPTLLAPAVSAPTSTSPRTPSAATAVPFVDASISNISIKPGVKEFCSFWLRNGECDYAQQGCRYKHEMPLDLNTLKSLGLRDIPRWYREKHGLGSFLAAGGSGAGFGGSGLKSTVVIGMPQEIAKPVMVQKPRADKPHSGRLSVGRRTTRNPVTPLSKRNSSNNQLAPRHERSSSIHSAIEYLKTRKQTPPESVSGKNNKAHEQTKRAKAQSAEEKRSDMLSSILDTLKLNAKLDEVKKNEAKTSEVASAEEADVSGTPSESRSTSTGTLTSDVTRCPSQVSMWSDIEADVHRKDAARKAKEDEAYRLSCEAYAAKNQVAPEKLEGKDVQQTDGSERQASKGGRRGRGHHRGGKRHNRNKKAAAKE